MTPPDSDDGTMVPDVIVAPPARRRRGLADLPPVTVSVPEPVAFDSPDDAVVPAEPSIEPTVFDAAPTEPTIDSVDARTLVEANDIPPEIAPTPDAPLAAPKPVAPIGSVDRFDFNEISGWAWNSETPDEPIEIEVVDGDAVVLRIAADRYRPDLQKNGIGDGRHGFLIRNLGGILPLSGLSEFLCARRGDPRLAR